MKHTFLEGAMKRSNTAYEEPRLLHEFFERQVKLRPDHPAVECQGEILTYSELDAAANRVAMSLRSRGICGGSLVAIYLEKSCGLFAAMLGILKAGAGYVPIDPKSPVARIESIVQDANVAVVISEDDLAERLKCPALPEILILSKALANKRARSTLLKEPVVITPNDACYVIYTSGSTGRPKGVIIEHRNATNFVRALSAEYKLNQDDRVYQGFSIAFDASLEEIWGAFSVGGTLIVPSEEIARSTFDAAEFIESQRITFFSTVPSFLATMTTALNTVRLLVLGGEVCPPELVNRFAASGRRLLNTYGPTEATVVATAVECFRGEPVTIGTALPGYITYVLDEQMRQVKPGESGELYIGGGSIARGYMNQPELTAERFLLDPFADQSSEPGRIYRTQDLVRLTENGRLQFLGRADGQIKIRGFRVELSEIEAVLLEHPSVCAAAANVVEFGNLKELAAYIIVNNDSDELSHASIAELLRSRLPEYMVPRYLDVLDEFPAMISGKVDRKQLPLPRTLLGGRVREIVPPATDLERTIVKIWEEQFHITPISVEDDFFLDLRGHSLIASHVVTELRSRLRTLHVSVTDLYEHRTARLLATHLKSIGVDTKSKATHDGTPVIDTVAEKAPLSRFRFACVALQAVGVLAYYGVVSAPLVFAIVLVLKVLKGEHDLIGAIDIATTVGFLVWPSWLVFSIVLKWTVIGRYKAGRYPVWGFYYFRWWLVSRFQTLSWSEMFVGTPLMSLYYRAMGAKVGKHCSIGTPLCTAFDLVTIGDNASIGSDTQILGYRIEDGWLIIGNVTIGSECYIGTHCCVGLGATMGDRSRLDDMSHLADGSIVDPGVAVQGSPAQITDVHLEGKSEQRFGRTVLFGLLHLGLIYTMGYILLLSLLPGLAVVAYALYVGGPLWGIVAALAATPISMIWYLLLVVAVKWIAIGQLLPGVYPLHSREYLRYWFLNFLLNNTRHIALALYATLFLPKFLKMLGAKIGRGVEISTAMHIMPDLLEIDDGSFLADACIVGGHRVHDGVIEIRRNRIGKRTFIGNSALVPVGIDVGDNSLIGVMSTPPMGVRRTADGNSLAWFARIRVAKHADVRLFHRPANLQSGL